jgi:protein-tyrosine phosphatase
VSWLRDRVRPVVHGFRIARDRMLHRHYRDRSIAALKGRQVREIVVICHGNICRSPYAEGTLRRKLAERGRADVVITSAGFVGPDRGSPAEALTVAAELGVDLSSHRSQLITGKSLASADLVVVMSPEQAVDVRWRGASAGAVVVLGDLDPGVIDSRTIRDPWKGTEDDFRSSYLRIDRCVEELVRILVNADPSLPKEIPRFARDK